MKIKNIFLFALINWVLWCLLSLRYYALGGFFEGAAGIVFTIFFILGHTAMFGAGMFLLLAPSAFLPGKISKVCCVLFGSVLTTALVVDIGVFSLYRFHIGVAMLELFFGPAGREIFVFGPAMYILAGVLVLFVCALQALFVYFSSKVYLKNKVVALLSILILLSSLLYNGMFAWGKFMAEPAVTAQTAVLPWASPISLNRRLRKMGYEPKAEAMSELKTGALNYPKNPLVCKENKKLNVLLILVDSLRFDMFTPDIMPNTYEEYIKQKAFYFTDHKSGGNATQAGVFSVFYGLTANYFNDFISERKEPVLFEEFKKQGYNFGLFSSGKLNSPEFNKNIFSKIENLRIESKGSYKYERDIDMQHDFEAFVSEGKEPFFGFLFYDSPHGFEYPPSFKEKFTPAKEPNYITLTAGTDPTPYLNRYKNAVLFTDSLLKEVFAALKARGLDKNTVVLITGDHGQEINDTGNNFWGHNSNFTKYQVNTPLLVFWPGKEGGAEHYRTSHYDIVPTIMEDVLGCTNAPVDYSMGQNLFDSAPRPYSLVISYINRAVITGENISVINAYGSLNSYDNNYKKTNMADAKAIAASLTDLGEFYK